VVANLRLQFTPCSYVHLNCKLRSATDIRRLPSNIYGYDTTQKPLWWTDCILHQCLPANHTHVWR